MRGIRGVSGARALRAEPSASLEVGLFALVAVTATFLFLARLDFSFAARDLIDTDGYMRFLRVRDLLEHGNWFDPVSTRSNYPFGEMLHWTRPLDAVVALGALVLTPFLGGSALYVSAVAFGPLSLIALGLALRWAFAGFVPDVVRPLLLPALLALPVVVGYMVPGRVDHHGLLFLLLVLTIGGTLRIIRHPERGTDAILVGVFLAIGLWVSPEFLVPAALVALTLGWHAVERPQTPIAPRATRLFLAAAGAGVLALLLERGQDWMTVDQARLSIVHPFLLLMVGAAFGGYVWVVRQDWDRRRRLGVLAALAVGAGLVVVLFFPDVLGGPFVEFSPLVKERWLFRVVELQSVAQGGVPGLLVNLAWALLALVLGAAALLRQRDSLPERWLWVTYGWMVAYVALSFYQMRWATFAQLLAVPILVAFLSPLYRRLSATRAAVVVRPLLLAAVIGLVAVAGPRLAAQSDPVAGGVDCSLSPVLPVLASQPATTLLAEQDVGPEILYRTHHRVVATPYGNEQAFLYTLEVMATQDMGQIRERLSERDIGLILVCPGRIGIMQPPEPSGTFYQALVAGPRPDFVRPMPLPEETDYLLFGVRP